MLIGGDICATLRGLGDGFNADAGTVERTMGWVGRGLRFTAETVVWAIPVASKKMFASFARRGDADGATELCNISLSTAADTSATTAAARSSSLADCPSAAFVEASALLTLCEDVIGSLEGKALFGEGTMRWVEKGVGLKAETVVWAIPVALLATRGDAGDASQLCAFSLSTAADTTATTAAARSSSALLTLCEDVIGSFEGKAFCFLR
jgi:hypothetical protein